MNPKLVLGAIHNWFRTSVLWQQGQSFGLWAMQCMFLFTYFQWFSCMLLKVNFCAWLLPFNCCHFDMCLCRICGIKCWLPWWRWDKRSLFYWHCMGWRGISKAVAWHAPRVLPLWWCPNGVPGLMLATMVKVGYALRVPLTLHGLALLYLKR